MDGMIAASLFTVIIACLLGLMVLIGVSHEWRWSLWIVAQLHLARSTTEEEEAREEQQVMEEMWAGTHAPGSRPPWLGTPDEERE